MRLHEEARARFLREAQTTKRVSEFLVNIYEIADPSEARGAWKESLSLLQPIVQDSQAVAHQSAYAQVLLCLGKVEEALPVVRKLLESGYRSPDLLDLCRAKGLSTKGLPGKRE